jgi:PilZ domain-containing protein
MNRDAVKELPAARGSDWTRLLTDPDLVSHLGKLLQTYREVAPEKREQALLKAMQEIKESAVRSRTPAASASAAPAAKLTAQAQTSPLPHPEPIAEAPPFELFDTEMAQDRRRHPRIKCYVAVELHVEGLQGPVWGNLSNVSRGGAKVEVATAIPPGKSMEIGLWVANGKIWVKGVTLTGVVTRTMASCEVRLKFSEAELSEKEHLREFLKFVDGATRKAHSGHAYVAQLKR